MNERLITVLKLAVALAVCQVSQAAAVQPPTTKKEPPIFEVSPAAEPSPALKFRLLPSYAQPKRGSAYPLYARLTAEKGDASKQHMYRAGSLIRRPLSEAATAEVTQYLASTRRVLETLRLASRRKRCDWEYPIGEVNATAILLPDVSDFRMFWPIQALQVRHLVALGKPDEAIEALQVGFAMARHIEQAPFVVHDLVAAACTRTLLTQVIELVKLPNAPNLYWALASLPRPFVDMRESIELDLAMFELSFPETKYLERIQTTDEWRVLLEKLLAEDYNYKDNSPVSNPRDKVAYLVGSHVRARRYFLAHNVYDVGQLDAMPLEELLVRWTLHPLARVRDDQLKWAFVPYHEIANRDYRIALADLADKDRSPFAGRMFHFATVSLRASVLLSQHLAALQVVEALRMHAANNDGELPNTLDDLTIVPVPKDPVTGTAFRYTLQRGVADLRSFSEDQGTIHHRFRMRSDDVNRQ